MAMITIAEAKEYLRQNFDKGANCPCCTQFTKRYSRKLTSGMAVALINLYNISDREYVHIERLGRLNGGEFAQLAHWGLIEEKPNEDDGTKRTSGYWHITLRGVNFVKGSTRVASHVYTFNGKRLGFSETSTDIHEALGKKFNYSELMGRV